MQQSIFLNCEKSQYLRKNIIKLNVDESVINLKFLYLNGFIYFQKYLVRKLPLSKKYKWRLCSAVSFKFLTPLNSLLLFKSACSSLYIEIFGGVWEKNDLLYWYDTIWEKGEQNITIIIIMGFFCCSFCFNINIWFNNLNFGI